MRTARTATHWMTHRPGELDVCAYMRRLRLACRVCCVPGSAGGQARWREIEVPARASWTARAQSPRWICRSAISCQVSRTPSAGEPICAPHGRCWRDASGAIAADSVIVPAARAEGTGLDIEARDDGPPSRPTSWPRKSQMSCPQRQKS